MFSEAISVYWKAIADNADPVQTQTNLPDQNYWGYFETTVFYMTKVYSCSHGTPKVLV